MVSLYEINCLNLLRAIKDFEDTLALVDIEVNSNHINIKALLSSVKSHLSLSPPLKVGEFLLENRRRETLYEVVSLILDSNNEGQMILIPVTSPLYAEKDYGSAWIEDFTEYEVHDISYWHYFFDKVTAELTHLN
jgi:hypothetical protein